MNADWLQFTILAISWLVIGAGIAQNALYIFQHLIFQFLHLTFGYL